MLCTTVPSTLLQITVYRGLKIRLLQRVLDGMMWHYLHRDNIKQRFLMTVVLFILLQITAPLGLKIRMHLRMLFGSQYVYLDRDNIKRHPGPTKVLVRYIFLRIMVQLGVKVLFLQEQILIGV